jgi:hypothetical protein
MQMCLVYAAHGTKPPNGVSASSVTDKRTRPSAFGNVKPCLTNLLPIG